LIYLFLHRLKLIYRLEIDYLLLGLRVISKSTPTTMAPMPIVHLIASGQANTMMPAIIQISPVTFRFMIYPPDGEFR
jgi:hypothetical protein